MKTSKTFNVYFWLKRSCRKKNGQIPIYARVNVDGIRADISVKRSTTEENWCKASGRLNPRTSKAKDTNGYLDDVYAKLLDCHRQLHSENGLITAQAIKLRYLGKDKSFGTLSELVKYHTDHELQKLEQGTAKNYSATIKYLLRFIKKKYNTPDINLAVIDYAFLAKFETYLQTCPPLRKSQPLNNNGIMKHMERFQKLMGIATKFGCVRTNPFNFYEFKFEQYDSDYLDSQELEKLASSHIQEIGIGVVRDIFIFSCYTGLAYIEVKLLKKNDIVTGIDGEEWINVRRKKTNTPVKVPLLEEAKRVLDRYSDFPNADNGHSLLPVYSNQKVNEYLKIIAKRTHIKKHLTFHVARHTFATTVTLLNNVPVETVSKLLGHTKLSTTQKYARVIERKISNDMTKLKAKLKESKRSPNYRETAHDHLRIV
ncbi:MULTISPECIES: site-specific integrase [Flavobacteriaceae]|uniref:Transposase n=1 Tax=Maribacter cobaltidurans TaxID=1178778 RepID=A0A223V884_9FLAO|nr:site-specific integrase [Maribacter cobaltidurans]ASV31506.1 transposase [Maribacter cobaltidurans]GGD96696.1 transposase [Maribacter cobaltidurans]